MKICCKASLRMSQVEVLASIESKGHRFEPCRSSVQLLFLRGCYFNLLGVTTDRGCYKSILQKGEGAGVVAQHSLSNFVIKRLWVRILPQFPLSAEVSLSGVSLSVC